MKIATWNVNSLKVRLPQVIDWLTTERPDVLCLQELKMENANFPSEALQEVGYNVFFNGQKTYNGVAILSSSPQQDAVYSIPDFKDEQKRIIATTINDIRIICSYFPNGQALGSEKFEYKMRWLHALTLWLEKELRVYPKLVLAGDFNIAPEPRDAHPQWKEEIHVSPAERAAFSALIELGLIDAFRLFEQPENSFSWWDYRLNAFKRNFGLRIDHLLLSNPLRTACKKCWIDKTPRSWERPSDHTPVVIELAV